MTYFIEIVRLNNELEIIAVNKLWSVKYSPKFNCLILWFSDESYTKARIHPHDFEKLKSFLYNPVTKPLNLVIMEQPRND